MTSLKSVKNEIQFDRVSVLKPEEAASFRALRLRGLREHPEAFGESAESFQSRTEVEIADRIRSQAQQGDFILVALSKSGEMFGVVGLALNGSGKSSHRGVLWGMYVAPEARGQRVGERLIEELLRRAEEIDRLEQIHLSVTSSNQAALRLYEKMGFLTYGTDPSAIKVGDRAFDEYLMVRKLRK